jgi:zinc/manganese transport system substrate-binding protein
MKLPRKKLVTMFLLAGVVFGFAAPIRAQTIRVIATIPDLADMAKQIGKELVDVESLTRGVEFMHAVPVKPSFVPRLNRANVLLHMGLDLEVSWLPALLEAAHNPKIQPGQPGNVNCSTGVSVMDVPRSVDRSEGDVHPKGNPHYNLDPVNGRFMARNIAEGLSRNYPQYRPAFEKNLNAYLAELDKAIERWQALAAPLQGVKMVTYHVEWSYFAKRYGLQQLGTIELKPGIEPTPNHLIALTQKMQQEKAQLIIFGPQSDRFPRQLASQTGATVVRLQSIAGGSPETDTYIKFIDFNLKNLLAALKKS